MTRPLTDRERTQRGLALLDAERSSRKLMNYQHIPAGSPQGGQFAPKDGGGGGGGGGHSTGSGGVRGLLGKLGIGRGAGGSGGGSGGGSKESLRDKLYNARARREEARSAKGPSRLDKKIEEGEARADRIEVAQRGKVVVDMPGHAREKDSYGHTQREYTRANGEKVYVRVAEHPQRGDADHYEIQHNAAPRPGSALKGGHIEEETTAINHEQVQRYLAAHGITNEFHGIGKGDQVLDGRRGTVEMLQRAGFSVEPRSAEDIAAMRGRAQARLEAQAGARQIEGSATGEAARGGALVSARGSGSSVDEQGGPSGKEAKAWAKEMRGDAGGDARYTKEGIATAASQPVDHEAIAKAAEGSGYSVHEAELEARMNMASIASVPKEQMSPQLRDYFFRSAARGEDTYAYPPASESPRTVAWNVWYRGQRARITELESAIRQSRNAPHGAGGDLMLPPGGGGSGLSEHDVVAAMRHIRAVERGLALLEHSPRRRRLMASPR